MIQSPKTLLVVGITCLLTYVGLGWLVTMGITQPLDEQIMLAIHGLSSPFLDTVFLWITTMAGTLAISLITAGIMVYLWFKDKYFQALLVGVAVTVGVSISLWSKQWYDRARPDLWPPLVHESTSSFPSSHAAASMSLTLVIILLLWPTKWRKLSLCIGGVYVFLVGLSRMYLGAHYPTDVLGGWLLAAAWITLLSLAVGKIPKRG